MPLTAWHLSWLCGLACVVVTLLGPAASTVSIPDRSPLSARKVDPSARPIVANDPAASVMLQDPGLYSVSDLAVVPEFNLTWPRSQAASLNRDYSKVSKAHRGSAHRLQLWLKLST